MNTGLSSVILVFKCIQLFVYSLHMCINKTYANIMVVEKFVASCYWLPRVVDQRTNNENTQVAVINVYGN